MGMIINPYRFGGGGGNQAEVTAYISGLSTALSSSQIALLNTFVGELKTGLSISELSEIFDVMYILAGETEESSLRNLISRNYDATAVASPAFVELEGFTGNDSSSYINTNFNPYANGLRYTLNDASFGIYSRTDRVGASANQIGVSDGTNLLYLRLYQSTGGRVGINSTTYISPTLNGATLGLISVVRNSSTNVNYCQNKTFSSNVTLNSSSAPNANIYLDALNDNGTAATFDLIQLSLAYAGKALNSSQLGVLFDAFEAYMDANGKGVVA